MAWVRFVPALPKISTDMPFVSCSKRLFHSQAPLSSSLRPAASRQFLRQGLLQSQHRTFSQNAAKSRKSFRTRGPITWTSVGALCVVGGGCLYYYSLKEQERYERMTATKLEQGLGKPTIGGPFRLVDHNGQMKTNDSFKGKWMLIYFGFTYCPDICPNELMRMADVVTRLDANPETAYKVEPLLITIDPERDGPNQLKDYLSDWHPRMLGLTGTPGDIRDVCKAYRVYFNKAVLGSDPTEYLIDHSIMFYLMDPDGEFADYFGKSLTPDEIHDKITKYITGTADASTHSDSSIGTKEVVLPETTGA
eukprot:CAMPEP_0181319700 /NCGR_PEP_ID=MMETSP1101-20121128/17719_1 /TAXON_ID=46948 /ORGANISM="Rhodomonas abbreviata, Strain Caron Lab Isolate" /LENGTH=306 /DNA_ID=CAMNT_0023427333 /DNA_START=9 /DNA_END=929 /DNA_ORIENTATION=-